jgi:hypothetical protein
MKISRIFRKNVEKMYLRQYPFLSLEMIKKEISRFEEVMIVNGTIGETSSNEGKYLRGWLSRANYEAQKKRMKLCQNA